MNIERLIVNESMELVHGVREFDGTIIQKTDNINIKVMWLWIESMD